MPITKAEIQAMTISERETLLNILWESIEKDNYIDNAREETEIEKQLLKERLEEYRSNPSNSIKWNDLKDELSIDE